MLAELNVEDPGDYGVYNFPGADGDFIKLSSGNKKNLPTSLKSFLRNAVATALGTEIFSNNFFCEIPIASHINHELCTHPEIITKKKKRDQKFILLSEKEMESLFP